MASNKKKKKKTENTNLSYPLRVACIDMGSNAIRFVAAEFSSTNEWRTLAAERSPVRLGHSVFLSGVLDDHAMNEAVQALARFTEQMSELGVEHCRAVATSAVRESKNGSQFVERIADETGLRVDVISGSEEARLVHSAVTNLVPLGSRKWLLVDLGGGSVDGRPALRLGYVPDDDRGHRR